MTTAFAWIEGEKASGAEKARALDADLPKTPTKGQLFGALHIAGPRQGELYVSIDIPTTPDMSYAERYRAALDALLAADKRVRNGHAYTLGLI